MTKTDRLYAAAIESFREWCRYHKVRFPPADHIVIGRYLVECRRLRGTSVRVHCAAIGRYYRDRGMPFDVKAHPIRDARVIE